MAKPRNSSDQARALLDGFDEPALLVRDARILVANQAAARLFGDSLEGKDVRLAIRNPAAIELLLAPPEARTVIELAGIGAPDRSWILTCVPQGDGSLLVRLDDRSETQAAEQMRTDFVANASHELRTPLATLLGYAETLAQGRDIEPPTRERFLGVIHDEAKRMARLVEDLISLSRIASERFVPPRERVDIAKLLEQAKRECRYGGEDRAADIALDVPSGLPAVSGESNQLVLMLDNLLTNALRYGRPGSPVRLSARQEGEIVQLLIADEGEGIEAEHIPRLTQRFYRVDPSRSRALGGTGLGLAIVKHIVERHRGNLSIESRVGEGTTVRVDLPVAA